MIKKINTQKLHYDYIEKSLIIAEKHPDEPLWILNYSPQVQALGLWDDLTRQCRGLVIDSEGNVVARSQPKFYNISNLPIEKIHKNGVCEVFEKIDGTLGVFFYYNGRWILASRGSFTSEAAEKGMEILNEKYGDFKKHLDVNFTYLFEIVYPENTIVIDYGDVNDCFMFAAINNHNGSEMHYDTRTTQHPTFKHIPRISRYAYYGMENLLTYLRSYKKSECDDKEGVVVELNDGIRVKIKYPEYIKKHWMETDITNHDIWLLLRNGGNYGDLLKDTPDEFYGWFVKTIKQFRNDFLEIECVAHKKFYNLVFGNGIFGEEFSEYAEKSPKYKEILQKLYNREDYTKTIWDMIEPEKQENPFKSKVLNEKNVW